MLGQPEGTDESKVPACAQSPQRGNKAKSKITSAFPPGVTESPPGRTNLDEDCPKSFWDLDGDSGTYLVNEGGGLEGKVGYTILNESRQ
jgi:hypothetical protein